MPAVKAEHIYAELQADPDLSNIEISERVKCTKEYVSEVRRGARHERQTLVPRLLRMVERKDEEITSELKRMNGMLEAIVNELHSN